MSAAAITDRLVEAIGSRTFDFIVVNYANPDMVGHTGIWEAAVRAAEVVDGCLGRVAEAVLAGDGALLITGDHGNIEEMRDATGAPQTKHTTSPVPLVLVGRGLDGRRLGDGRLTDVAPTICALLGMEPGPEMTGSSLLEPAPD
jgi:2,3-bisphosphoglycerate-independent phosphoglycerate mutase